MPSPEAGHDGRADACLYPLFIRARSFGLVAYDEADHRAASTEAYRAETPPTGGNFPGWLALRLREPRRHGLLGGGGEDRAVQPTPQTRPRSLAFFSQHQSTGPPKMPPSARRCSPFGVGEYLTQRGNSVQHEPAEGSREGLFRSDH
jgi:hypothetical protein